jgi:hypothetical protein
LTKIDKNNINAEDKNEFNRNERWKNWKSTRRK